MYCKVMFNGCVNNGVNMIEEVTNVELVKGVNVVNKLQESTKDYLVASLMVSEKGFEAINNRRFKEISKVIGGFNKVLDAVNDLNKHGKYVDRSNYFYIKVMSIIENIIK